MTSFHQLERALAFLAVILAVACTHADPSPKTGDLGSNSISEGMRDVAAAGVNVPDRRALLRERKVMGTVVLTMGEASGEK